ncbi:MULTISPECIES: aminotransferase class V-fold PLP-dependent enzyme [Peptoniphilus]|uniref:aminotransferase class V-fold PLP-dependent enzyme n=1 Tax=Peptoniphilus TaxID=162289 RepID=UPI000784DF2E|nr:MULTISPECIES: SufS family cysteine desulfurase [Peptoniphilus]KXB72226.1 cysteine desulfurase, SufS subfamily [Peptoniphilus sp. DNF00840]
MFTKNEIEEIRKEFPFLNLKPNGKQIVYFDNGATTQKPREIIDNIKNFYECENGNPHRGAHYLAMKSTEVYEDARQKIADFIGARKASEVVFLRNATEALNLLAYSYGLNNLKEGDEIVISIMEHHSNLVPWQEVCKKTGAKLKFLYLDHDMQIPFSEIEEKVTKNTKLISITGASNVVGTNPDIEKIVKYARENSDAKIILDGAQLVPHRKVNVSELDVDFMAFSGHKMYSALGIGVLYGKEELLNKMDVFLTGGDMIEYVYEDHTTFLDAPQRFEAGTTNVEGAVNLAAAIDFINKYGMEKIDEYERFLTDYCYYKLKKLNYLDVYTTSDKNRAPVISFNFKEAHPHDVASILDTYGIAIRSGHHCAQPLHRYLGSNFSCRASFAIYNTVEEIDYFVEHLEDVRRILGIES